MRNFSRWAAAQEKSITDAVALRVAAMQVTLTLPPPSPTSL